MNEVKNPRILIVDDDDPIRNIYVDIFRKEDFEVEEAIDGVEGLDKATKNIPDIVFTGIVMPRMDGFGFIEALKKNVTTANIPVVISSHLGRKEDEEKAYGLGVKDFIIRHLVTPKEAVERVRRVLGSGEYKIKINIQELDAPRLIKDFHFREKFQCPNCDQEMALSLFAGDVSQHEFKAKFVCPNCGK